MLAAVVEHDNAAAANVGLADTYTSSLYGAKKAASADEPLLKRKLAILTGVASGADWTALLRTFRELLPILGDDYRCVKTRLWVLTPARSLPFLAAGHACCSGYFFELFVYASVPYLFSACLVDRLARRCGVAMQGVMATT